MTTKGRKITLGLPELKAEPPQCTTVRGTLLLEYQ